MKTGRPLCVLLPALLAVISLGLAVRSTPAATIFDTGATNVQSGGDDVNPVNVDVGFAFTFYGVSGNNIRVGSNGAFAFGISGLSGTQYDSSQTPWYSATGGILAVLWDDLNTAPTSAPATGIKGGTSSIGNTTYTNSYSLTAPAAFTYGTGHLFTTEVSFQLSLFNANMTVTNGNGNQFSFQAGDIAFSYGNNTIAAFEGGRAAVGVSQGGGSGNFTGAPGTQNGNLTTANRTLLPTGENFYLFRWNGSGYTSSTEVFAVPEPASVGLLAMGVFGIFVRRRRA